MKTFKHAGEVQELSDKLRAEGKKIGFVPTMGFLHAGHISLIQKSKSEADVTIVSIFVNPTQFAPNEDFNKYPRDIEKDKKILEDNGVDYLFMPEADEIYPSGFQTFIEVQEISKKLEGEFRPVHFKGVTTVVAILFNIVKPHIVFFGQKDAQQAAIINQMTNDLKFDVQIKVCPIIRETDGLAMSSRNVYLAAEERNDALALYNSLMQGKKLIEDGEKNPHTIINHLQSRFLNHKNIQPDYIAIVNAENFHEPENLKEGNEYYILIAARVGKTRLIDNVLIKL